MEIHPVTFNFSADKNCQLINDRGISFEEIIAAIDAGYLVDILEHFNVGKYSHQKIYIVEFNHYIYLVPFVKENNDTIFLKTIIPSRKATKRYLKGKYHDKK